MTNSLRILILNERDPAHPRAGGAEIHVEEIFSRLAARGHSIHQYSAGFAGGEARVTRNGIRLERVGPLVRYYAGVPGRLNRARRTREFDIIVECLNKVPFYAPVFAGCPVLALCHHLFGEVAFSQVAAPLASLVWLAERGLPQSYRNTRFLAISESSRNDLIARGISPKQIDVSPPGVTRPERPVDLHARRPRRITYLGRLEAYKRVDLVLQAASKLVERFPDLEIEIVGRGSQREALEALADRLGLSSRTHFAGFVSDPERDALLAATRACVFPSEKEGWGLTVIEANALGTPVVASDAPGLRDSVRPEETGILVEPRNADAIARAIARLLDDSSYAYEMRAAALEWSRRFDWDRAADEMEIAIERSISGSKQ